MPQGTVRLLDRPRLLYAGLVLVLLVAAWFRLVGLEWDSGRHIHPDERFLSMTTNDLKWTGNLDTYFDPATSTLSPYSLPRMGLYVYGTLPVYIVKGAAILLNSNNYDRITLIGRAISALMDLGAIFFLFLLGRRLYGSKVGLLAAGLLSLSVLNIQLSHFYAVDTFANLFIVATFFFLVRATSSGRWLDYALTGLMFGLGLSSKLSVFTLSAPILAGVGLDLYRRARGGNVRPAVEHSLVRLLTVFVIAALTFRVLQPIAFGGPSFWDWSLNPVWVKDILEQEKMVSGDADLPWVQQWTDRSVLFPLYNIVVWGLGLPLGLAGLAGFGLAAFELLRRRKVAHLLPLVYVTVTFLYHALTFVKFIRYFLPIYPFLALFAAYLIAWLWRRARANEGDARANERAMRASPAHASPVRAPAMYALRARWQELRALHWLRAPVVLVIAAVIVGGTLLYATAFSAIYNRANTRIEASRWMYQNLPPGSTLANEHWDDWLPIGGVDGKTSYGDKGLFQSVEMKNYEDDTPAKLDLMVENLTKADYIVLSSNRLYDSIPRLPARYPMTTRYYQLLFEGKLGFTRIAEFTSYPTLLGVQLNDQGAEESFSVYDHPRVQIFKKTDAFDPHKVHELLGGNIKWDAVLHLTPRQVTAAPQALQLTAEEQKSYAEVAAWSSAKVNEDSWGSRLPVPAWAVAIELLGLIALPMTLVAFGRLADRGYIFSKAIGLLVVSWGAWMLASARLAPFTLWTILAVVAAFAAVSLAIALRRRNELLAFLKTRWRLVLLEEGLFWIFMALSLAIRWNNPDLWHPGLGGEKPMDLAYLTAIVRTPYFPSYDPWFAGGYINYYYFGFVLVAVLIHLTGVVPTIAYNLAVPTFFALTAAGSFAVTFNFVEGWQNGRGGKETRWLGVPRAALLAGLCGAVFVVLLGNLGQVQLLWNGIRNLSTIKAQDTGAPLLALAQFIDGAARWLGGRDLGFHTEWWYWNATRVIPPAQGEAGPINEMPFFTFLYADLHAHMMALPYTLVVLGLALNVVRYRVGAGVKSTAGRWHNLPEVLTLGLLALTTGALFPINTWDFPTYTLLAAAALACREYARRGRVDVAGLWAVGWRVVLIVVAGRVLFLPFFESNASAYFGAELWSGSRTPLWAYLIIHGFFLFILISYLLVELARGRGHNAQVRALRLNLVYWRRRSRMQRLFQRIVHPTGRFRFASDAGKVCVVLVGILVLLQPVIGLALGLAGLTALMLFSRPNPRRQFLLCMIGLGLLLTALVEVVVLKGDISRMNTVFKFYFQVWVLWAVASAGVLPQLATWLRAGAQQVKMPAPEPPEGSPWTPEVQAEVERWRGKRVRRWRQSWWWAFGLLLMACLLYPLTATPARMGDRFKASVATTLDGTAYMQTATYSDQNQTFQLDRDRRALEWLRENVRGIPTILEATTPLYRWGSRVSIYTGLPTVIGWDWHQKQQRSVLPGSMVDKRIEDVRKMYTSTDADETLRLLQKYGVRYIYVGALEQIYYPGKGLEKFDAENGRLWDEVYANEQVKIYKLKDF